MRRPALLRLPLLGIPLLGLPFLADTRLTIVPTLVLSSNMVVETQKHSNSITTVLTSLHTVPQLVNAPMQNVKFSDVSTYIIMVNIEFGATKWNLRPMLGTMQQTNVIVITTRTMTIG